MGEKRKKIKGEEDRTTAGCAKENKTMQQQGIKRERNVKGNKKTEQ